MRPIIWENLSLVPMMMSLFAAVKRSQEAKFAERGLEDKVILDAGMYTMNEVKRFLRAGMGLCQGQSCNKTVRAIIAQELGISPTETDVITARSPVRPVPMGVYGNDTFYPKFLGGGRDE